MSTYSVAVIGTGPDPTNPSVEGFAMGYRHAEAFASDERCDLVGCADIVPENGAAFADEFGLDEGAVYEDYVAMLEDLQPDIVTVAVPPAVHHDVVVGCAESGRVDAIHCEKPMADTWSNARHMVTVCDERDVQLTFNRQRRFGKPFTEANRLLDDGNIGSLERIEIGWGDFYDTGAHTVDLAAMFNDEHEAEWVLAGLDYREEDLRFGAHQENQMWAQWRYENGVYGMLATGQGADMVGAAFVLRGTDGVIRIAVDDGPTLELERDGVRETVDVDGESIHSAPTDADRFGAPFHDRVVVEIVDALASGRDSPLDGHHGLRAEEILFAGYESVRRRGRVDLPLEIGDHPLTSMVESGALDPKPRE